MSQRATELAKAFEEKFGEFGRAVEATTDAEWAAVCGDEGWTVGQTAQHVSGQIPLEMQFISAAAEGRTMPVLSWDELNEKNGSRAQRNRSVTKADVMKELRTNVATTAAYIRGLSDEQLDRKGTLSLADGAAHSTQQLIESGVLIEHAVAHGESIRKATAGVAARA